MAEIEPAFRPLISVCRELETPAGFLDNLWMTPSGAIVIGECKLVRNPQARREVISQALDYVRAISGWNYEQLEQQVAKALKPANTTLWSMVSQHTDLDEPQFVDAVERRLRTGRFMVLIIGDGIQEGAEALTSYLQLHAGLHVGIALVDLSIWRAPDSGLIVVPRIPLKTVLIERGIVRLDPSRNMRIDPPNSTTFPSVSSNSDAQRRPQSYTLSEEEYFDQLEQRRPGLAPRLQEFVSKLPELGVTTEFRKSLVLRWHASPDVIGSLGYIETSGKVWFGDAWVTATKLDNSQAGEAYLKDIAAAIGGSVRRYQNAGAAPAVLGPDGRGVDVAALLDREQDWLSAIAKLVSDCTDPG
jgi:hypothetical protein